MTPNPFEYSKPIADPDRFFGRQSELTRLRDACHQVRSVSVVGERRIGKSSLLKLFTVPKISREFGFGKEFVFCFNDLQGFEDSQPEQFWDWVLSELAPKLPEESLQLSVQRTVKKKTFDNTSLRRLFEELKSIKIIFLFDEFESILQNPNFSKSFYGHLRYLTQKEHPVAFVTATRRELVYHVIDDDTKSSPFFNIFDNLVIRQLGEAESRNLVKTYLRGADISFTESELTKLLELSSSYAAFFQTAGSFLFSAYQNKGLKDDEAKRWSRVEENFRSHINPHLTFFWSKSEEDEQILLTLLALLTIKDNQSVPEKKIKDLYPRYKNDLLTLYNRSLVLRSNGHYRLFSPLFAEWIVIELTNISPREDRSLEEWLTQYEKSFLKKGFEKVGDIGDKFNKVNPKYWDLLGKALLLVRDPKPLIEILDKLGPLF